MKRISPSDIEYFDMDKKRFLLYDVERKCRIAKKYTIVSLIFYFILAGTLGWSSGFSLMLGKEDGQNIIFTPIAKILFLMLFSVLLGSYFRYPFVIASIFMQMLCISIIFPLCRKLCIVNIISIILYLRVLFNIPVYNALAEQEGFPHFLDNQQQGR